MKALDLFVEALESEGVRFAMEDMTEIRNLVIRTP